MYRQYDGLISSTQFLQKKFDDCSFTMQQAIISNGVDTDIFYPAPQKDKEIFNLVYVGRLDPAKNIPLLLDALHLLRTQKNLKKNIRCTIVG